MKKIIVLFLAFLWSVQLFAQSDRYTAAMTKFVSQLDTTKSKADFQKLANQFELIATKEKGQWLPFYYAAFCNASLVYQSEKDLIDVLCDKAEAMIKVADSLAPNNSEIMVMRARICSARIMVNPMTRGQKYGKQSASYLELAKKLEIGNPRISLTEGTAYYYTPKMFGGGQDKAKPVLADASAKFEVGVPASPIHPHWGSKDCNWMLSQCKD